MEKRRGFNLVGLYEKLADNVMPGAKTLDQLLEENDRKLGFFVKSPSNRTRKYKMVGFNSNKNLAILMRRAPGIYWYKKYYDLYVLNNPRWFRV